MKLNEYVILRIPSIAKGGVLLGSAARGSAHAPVCCSCRCAAA